MIRLFAVHVWGRPDAPGGSFRLVPFYIMIFMLLLFVLVLIGSVLDMVVHDNCRSLICL